MNGKTSILALAGAVILASVWAVGCGMVRKILPANRVGWDLLDNALAEGRRGCKRCLGPTTVPMDERKGPGV